LFHIREGHWLRHKDPNDDFDLFEAFDFRRPPGIRKPMALKAEPQIKAKAKERQVQGGREKVCQKSDKAIDTKKELATLAGVSHDTVDKVKTIEKHATPQVKELNSRWCRACGAERETRHTYCPSCGRERKRHTHQQRQRRYRQRHAQAVKA